MKGRSDCRSIASSRFSLSLKIILLAVLLLAFSQGLGTLLSVSFFEKRIEKNLLDRYKIIGNDLRSRIEQSLRFGKHLDRLIGLEEMVTDLFQQADDIQGIVLFQPDGRILFSAKRSHGPAGQAVYQPDDDAPETISLPQRFFPAIADTFPRASLLLGNYHLLFAIPPIQGNPGGILDLIFPASPIDDQKRELAGQTITKLLVSLSLTAMLMAIALYTLFSRPCRKQTEQILSDLQSAADDPVLSRNIPEEIRMPAEHILLLQQWDRQAEQDLVQAMAVLRRQTDDPDTHRVLSQITDRLKRRPDARS